MRLYCRPRRPACSQRSGAAARRPPGSEPFRRLPAVRRGPAVLRPPPGTLLEQSVNLPLAAEPELAAVLRNEMDRLTPFRAADLFWDWRIERRDRSGGRLLLRLLLVPKSAVEATAPITSGSAW